MKQTDINDYVKQVHEKFPELTESEIKRILVYGWKMILQYISHKNDLHVRTKDFFCFIGRMPKDTLKMYETYKRKLANRIAYMFKRTEAKWDGYYYFSRTENQYIDYLKQSKRKYKIFKNVFLYRLLDQLKVDESSNPYIFRLEEDRTKWLKKYYPEIKTDKAELIIQRDPMTIQDMMTSQNKFKYIQ